jgi:hypothetical protein
MGAGSRISSRLVEKRNEILREHERPNHELENLGSATLAPSGQRLQAYEKF